MFTDEKPIKQVINELLNAYKLNGKIDELYIYVESAPLKSELTFHRSVILQKINAYFGTQIVKEIHIK